MPNKQRQLLVTSNLDTEDIDDLEEQVWRARKKLFDALKKENSNNSDLGGLEGYGTLLRLAAMDKDGSMEIEDAEVKQAEAAAEKLVDQTLNVSLNGGVISALLLSMVFPYTLEPIAVADEAVNFFGSAAVQIMHYIYLTALFAVIGLALFEVWASAFVYLALASWMVDTSSKQWWINDSRHLLKFTQASAPFLLCLLMMIMMVMMMGRTRQAGQAWHTRKDGQIGVFASLAM